VPAELGAATLTAVMGGRWTPPAGADRHDVYDPGTEAVIARFEESPPDLVAAAVEDAHRAWQGKWGPWTRPSAAGCCCAAR